LQGASPGTGNGVAAAGVTITAGETLYTNASGQLALSQGTSATLAKCTGIALNGASPGQPVNYIKSGNLTLNAALTVGITYCVSAANAGKIAPISDLSSGSYTFILGVATTTTNLSLIMAGPNPLTAQ